jgi:single-stranded-DNA-specific exonuclease
VIDENRLIIKLGLRMIENTERYGLQALIDAAAGGRGERQGKKRKINSGFIGFTIAPRMNAAGRVSRASIAVELLLAEDEQTAFQLAEELCRLNLERQTEENRIAEEAYQKIEETLDREHDRVIVIEDDSWHQGIIGIVSSRITERYGLPSILISFDGTTLGEPLGTDIGKGSGRSIKGVNLVEALMHCESLLVRYGGHELAAGLSVRRCNIEGFRKKINDYAAEHLTEEDLCVSIDADCEVDIRDLTMTLAQEITSMEPFGIANPVPNMVLKNVRITRIIPMGGGKHLRLVLQKDGIDLSAVWFGTGLAQFPFELWETVDVLFQLSINEFQNVTSLQLVVQDMRHAADFEQIYQQQLVRYEEIRNGALFDSSEDVIPGRDDIALVFSTLRKEYRAGHTVFSMRRILAMLSDSGIHYIKLKFIIRIMQELQVCGVSEPTPDRYLFEFGYRAEKTNIEKSSILRKLKGQLRKG